jgi:EmrB/QacA subfamily drug resistance transporter
MAVTMDAEARRRARTVLALTSAMAFMSTLDISIVIVAFGDIRRSFEASAAQLSWVITAYTILTAALLVPAGRLADRVGARTTFLAGVALFTLGSLGAGLAPSAALLIAARVVQALGGALQAPACLSLISQHYVDNRSTAVGIWGAVSGLGSALGPSVGALITETLGWRWVFLVNVPIGVAVTVIGVRLLKTSPRRSADPPDVLGSVLIIVGVSALVVGLVQRDEWGGGSPAVLVAYVIGLVSLGLLLRHCRRYPAPIIDLTLFRIPSFRLANGVAFSLALAFFVQLFGLVQFFTGVWGYSSLGAGLLITPMSAITAGTTAVAGRIADRHGHRAAMVPGALLYLCGCAWLLWRLGPEREIWTAWAPACLLLGVGVGLTYATFNSAAVWALPPARYGSGSAVNLTINRTGGTFGVALAVALLGTAPTASSYRSLWWLMVLGGVLTLVLSNRLDTRGPAPTH